MADRTWMKLWFHRKDAEALGFGDETLEPVTPEDVARLHLGIDYHVIQNSQHEGRFDVVSVFHEETTLPLEYDGSRDAPNQWKRGEFGEVGAVIGCTGNHYTYDSCAFALLPAGRLPDRWTRSGYRRTLPSTGVVLAPTISNTDEWSPVVRYRAWTLNQSGKMEPVSQSEHDEAQALVVFRRYIMRGWLRGLSGDWTDVSL